MQSKIKYKLITKIDGIIAEYRNNLFKEQKVNTLNKTLRELDKIFEEVNKKI